MQSVSQATKEKMLDTSIDMCDFLRQAVTPFHAVQVIKSRLRQAGFLPIPKQSDDVTLQRGGKYLFTRNGSSLAALVIGKKYAPSNGANIIAAHTDSPTLMLKPQSGFVERGMEVCGVQCYGGGLWHTWFDRDLSLAGRVVLQRKATGGDAVRDLGLHVHLVNIDKPIACIPNLAIHLQTADEREKLTINKETHLAPITSVSRREGKALPSAAQLHDDISMEILSQLGKSDDFEIVDHELCFYDANGPIIGGMRKEFIRSARLDNLASCYAAVEGLLETVSILEESERVHIVALYDHEEIGSRSLCGAEGNLLGDIIDRVVRQDCSTPAEISSRREAFLANSFCVSADCAHAVHPNYADKHESRHAPSINGGLVLKRNASMKYATQAISSALMRKIAQIAGVRIQDFVGRNDKPCGSTIGPIISCQTGIETVDMGIPLLAMHSIRETCGVADVNDSVKFFAEFLRSFHALKNALVGGDE
ncbi:aspartyl aminopeptidase [Perkinsela sp. CCAP 1560/4]|nr:aspartyl aminopeptidase [Perkinsela sp. CCAP 1560/4]|eukprot:KNH07719.1 aspartyl aminopeptidase [Perkinsela sp. CCAP 1560/4]